MSALDLIARPTLPSELARAQPLDMGDADDLWDEGDDDELLENDNLR